MTLEIEELCKNIAVLHLSGAIFGFGDLANVDKAENALVRRGVRAIVFSLKDVRRLPPSGLCALVEYLVRDRQIAVAAFGLHRKAVAELSRLNLSMSLPIYTNLEEALTSDRVQAAKLNGTCAVFLDADGPTSLAGLAGVPSVATLDVAGRSVFDRAAHFLSRFGVLDLYIHAPGDRAGIRARLSEWCQRQSSMHLCSELSGASVYALEVLRKIQVRHAAFQDDFFVFPSMGFGDVDLAAAMVCHKDRGSDVTVITTGQHSGRSQTGSFRDTFLILSPDVLDNPVIDNDLDLRGNLVSSVPSGLLTASHFQSNGHWYSVETEVGYRAALEAVLTGRVKCQKPTGQEVSTGIWLEEGADLSRSAQLTGPVFVGASAKVSANARLLGRLSIASGATIGKGAFVERSIILDHTNVEAGATVSDQIVAAGWALPIDPPTERPRLESVPYVANRLELTA